MRYWYSGKNKIGKLKEGYSTSKSSTERAIINNGLIRGVVKKIQNSTGVILTTFSFTADKKGNVKWIKKK